MFLRSVRVFCAAIVALSASMSVWAEDAWVERAVEFTSSIEHLPRISTDQDWQAYEASLDSLPANERLTELEALAFMYVIEFKFDEYQRVVLRFESLAKSLNNQQALKSLELFDVLVSVAETGDFEAAEQALRSLSVRKDLSDAQRLRTLVSLGYILTDMREHAESMSALGEAQHLSRSMTISPLLRADLSNASRYTLAAAGDFAGAYDHLVVAYEMDVELSRPVGQVTILSHLTLMLIESGNYEQALEINEKAIALAQAADSKLDQLYAYLYCGVLHGETKQFSASADCYILAGEHIEVVSERRPRWLQDTAYMLIKAERLNEAQSYYDLILDEVNEGSVDPSQLSLLPVIEAEILNASGQHEEAFSLLSKHREDELVQIERDNQETAAQLRGLVSEEAEHLRARDALNHDIIARQRLISALIGFLAIGAIAVSYVLWKNRNRMRQVARRNLDLFREAQGLAKNLKEKSQHAEWLAHRDPLTGLLNRRGFLSELEAQLVAADQDETSIALGILDLDRFKPVNDTYGHQAGDALLVELANRLRSTLGESALIGRLGGDEFAVAILAGPNSSETYAAGHAIRDALRQKVIIGEAQLHPQASIGFALHPSAAETREELFQNADYALYRAKEAREGGMLLFDDEMKTKSARQNAMELALGEASSDEFYMVYQPIIDLKSKRVLGFEALARWNSSIFGEISPAEFIPIAERSGKMTRLTKRFLSKALYDARKWPNHLTLSVNLSASDLCSLERARELNEIILASHVNPTRILLEITETGIIRDAEIAAKSLEYFKRSGVRVALDDFGTGHASLIHLHKFPIDRLKVDLALTQAVETDEATRATIEFVIGLCARLDIECVIEGISSDRQLNLLEKMSASVGQGYYFAHPMAAGDTMRYLRDAADLAEGWQTQPRRNPHLHLVDSGASVKTRA